MPVTAMALFQSSPNPKVGRYWHPGRACRSIVSVSILAQPEGRALLRYRHPSPRTRSCFNPRPTRRSGATNRCSRNFAPPRRFQSSPNPKVGRYQAHILADYRRTLVSILAQPEGRALHIGRHAARLDRRVSILAQPEGRALRRLRDAGLALHDKFQSSPNPEGRALQ